MFIANQTHTSAAVALATALTAAALAQDPQQPYSSSPSSYISATPATIAKPGIAENAKTDIDADAKALDQASQPALVAKQPEAVGVNLPFPPRTRPQVMLDSFKPAAQAALRLVSASIEEMPMLEQNGETLIALRLPQPLGDCTVRLHKYSMREEGARLVVQVEGGLIIDHDWPEVRTYRGTVSGHPELEAAASIRDGEVSLMLLPNDPAQDVWFAQPLSDALPGMPAGLHVIYRAADVMPTNRGCGVGEDGVDFPDPAGVADAALLPPFNPQHDPHAPPAPFDPTVKPIATGDEGDGGIAGGDDGSIAVANVRCQIALDADYEYYQANNSSVLDTIYEMERMMNYVGPIYQNQVGIQYTETFIIIRSNISDPYTTGLTGSGMRDQFRDWWINNHAGVTRDVAHLFSNRSASDGFIGFAYFAGICNANNGANSGYCWSSTFWSTDLSNKVGTVAHELGHVWNATHCDGAAGCGIMNSSINGSWSFGTPSANLIIAHRDSRGCLDVWFDPCYVNWAWAGVENGSISNPWNTIFEGLDACLTGGTLNVQAGNYLQNPNIFRAKRINAIGGTVRIGN